jgi:c(7)-type cytochrome triheme protein
MSWRAGVALTLVVLVLAVVEPAGAVPPGFMLEFDGNGEGAVRFAGATHTGKGMHCADCHLEIFDVSRSSQIKRADHRRRRFCFTCHDGVVAFAPRSNCERCHAETEPAMATATAAAAPPPAQN